MAVADVNGPHASTAKAARGWQAKLVVQPVGEGEEHIHQTSILTSNEWTSIKSFNVLSRFVAQRMFHEKVDLDVIEAKRIQEACCYLYTLTLPDPGPGFARALNRSPVRVPRFAPGDTIGDREWPAAEAKPNDYVAKELRATKRSRIESPESDRPLDQSSSPMQEHKRRAPIEQDEDADTCPVCHGPGRKTRENHCSVCYNGIYNDARKVIQFCCKNRQDPGVRGEKDHDLEVFRKYLSLYCSKGCPTALKCPPSAYSHDLSPKHRCHRCRTLACLRILPNLSYSIFHTVLQAEKARALQPKLPMPQIRDMKSVNTMNTIPSGTLVTSQDGKHFMIQPQQVAQSSASRQPFQVISGSSPMIVTGDPGMYAQFLAANQQASKDKRQQHHQTSDKLQNRSDPPQIGVAL